jgi:PIN domain nuclease of toxin-antitoxin system
MADPDVAVVDAHAMIWAVNAPRRLGRRARAFFDSVERGERALYVPTMVLVELSEAHADGDFAFDGGRSFAAWLGALDRRRYIPVDLSPEIVMQSLGTITSLERGDRLIAATALHLDCPLISRDPAIAEHTGLSLIW